MAWGLHALYESAQGSLQAILSADSARHSSPAANHFSSAPLRPEQYHAATDLSLDTVEIAVGGMAHDLEHGSSSESWVESTAAASEACYPPTCACQDRISPPLEPSHEVP